MKKAIWGLTIVLLLIVGTALIGPSMIDWNRYKGEVTKQAKIYTGRDLVIRGDVEVSLFPAPALIANDVSFSNLPGAYAKDMVRLERAEVRIAMSPLLAGQVKVETVRLIKPVIELELLADGKQNWVFETQAPKPQPAQDTPNLPSASSAEGASAEPSVVLDDFTIVDGALTYRDTKAGTVEKVKDLNARIEAASLSGPFQSKGDLTLRDIPLTYDITVGEVIQERTLPLNMQFGVGAGETSLHVGGTLLNLSENPKFKGTLRGEGKNLSSLIEAITRAPAPQALAQLFSVEANVSASAEGAEITELQMQLANSRVEGDVAIEMDAKPRFSITLNAGRFDLDTWLSAANKQTPSKGASQEASTGQSQGSNGSLKTPLPTSDPVVAQTVEIPDTINGTVIVSVEALVYRGEAISDVFVNSELSDGKAHLRQFSAQFPGGSDIALSGTLTSPDGNPAFAGNIETSTNDLRRIVKWLGVEFPNIPPDRLRKIGFSSGIKLTPDSLLMQNLNLGFDSSRLTGAATIALRSRPAFGLNLTLDQIDLDAYQISAVADEPAVASASAEAPPQAPAKANQTVAPTEPQNPFSGLAALADFDANALISVKRLGIKGEAVKNLSIDATLYNGNLELRKLDVSELAGLAVKSNGQINNLRGLPELKDFLVVASSKNLTPLFRFAGIELPFSAKRLGATRAEIRTNGSVLKPKVQANLKTADANLSANGSLSVLPVGDLFDLNVTMSHPDAARLLRTFGATYRPAGQMGALSFATRASGDASLIRLDQLSGKLGEMTYSGLASVNLSGPVPKVVADLRTGAIILDTYLPADQKARLDNLPWGEINRRPVVWPGPVKETTSGNLVLAAISQRWPTDPIDLSGLKGLDADIELEAPLVTYSKYLLEKVDLAASLKEGVLKVRHLEAGLFGGSLKANAEVSANQGNRYAGTLKIAGADIAEALQSTTGNATASGKLDVNFNLNSSGQSVADMVGSLQGAGAFTLQNVNASTGSKGAVLAGLYSLLSSLNRLGSSKTGNATNVAGSFQIAQGVAQTTDLKLVSPLGSGDARGTVDLAGWVMDVTGQIELQQSALTQLLQAKLKRGARPVGFKLTGPIDEPNVKVDTGALLGSTVPIPGANTLLNKAPKGIGKLLDGILGGGANQNAPPPANDAGTGGTTGAVPPPPRSTQDQNPPSQKLKPEDLLKQLFK